MKKNELNTLVFAGLAVLLALYAFGQGGIFFIDDDASLSGLLTVKGGASALNFVLSGDAGPLGRPVALATFLMQRGAYPDSAAPFLWANIAIHLFNVVLLGLLVWRLQRQLPAMLLRDQAPWLPVAVAFLWGVLPILASASLMVVQRMTTLSALFTLLAAHAYLSARTQAMRGHWLGTVLAIASIGACTVLSALSKENGVLVPLLLLVLHYGLFVRRKGDTLSPAQTSSMQMRVLTLCLWLPSLAVLGYLAGQLPSVAGHYLNRPFNLSERLASETVILWEYLRVAFFPRLADLSPFRDDYPIRHFSDPLVILALVAWVLLISLALWRWRSGKGMLLFAVAWYLVAHLLESSFFALFLYFEHRNYMPLMGPVIALVVWVAGLRVPSAGMKAVMAGAYGVFLAFMLWQTTSTWGNRQQLVWARAHPDSPRAMQMLAGAYMQVGRVPEVESMYAGALQRNPALTSVAIQGLRASCYLHDEGAATRTWLERASATLPTGEFSHLSINALQAVVFLQLEGRCAGVTAPDLLHLADLLQRNPGYAGASSESALHALRANVYLGQQNVEGAMAEMRKALQAQPDIETVRVLYRLTLQQQGASAAAELVQWIDRLPAPGRSAFARQYWRQQLASVTQM